VYRRGFNAIIFSKKSPGNFNKTVIFRAFDGGQGQEETEF